MSINKFFNISICNIAQALGESNRFLFHVFLIHITTVIVNGKSNFSSKELTKTLFITAIAIALYHILFRKLVEPKVNKMKLICHNKHKRIKRKKKLDHTDPFVSQMRKHTTIQKN